MKNYYKLSNIYILKLIIKVKTLFIVNHLKVQMKNFKFYNKTYHK